MTLHALDTSAAIPLLVASHPHHRSVTRWCSSREIALTSHSLAETYSVLTRLPGDARVTPDDTARLLSIRFEVVLAPDESTAVGLPSVLAEARIAGGATYDALVALAARRHEAVLVSRDARAVPTYRALGVSVQTLD